MLHDDKDMDTVKTQLCSYARLAYERRLAAGTGGNLSARASADCVLVTPSGVSLGELKPDQIVAVDMAGKAVGEARGYRPSKESSWHLQIMRARPDVGGVVHLHSPYCVGVSYIDPQWPGFTVTAAKYLRPCSRIVPASEPGSDQLASDIIDAVESSDGDANLIILAAHGIVALGATVREAFHIADLAEEAARTAVIGLKRDV